MNKQRTDKQTKAIIDKFNELYIMARKKYLEQVGQKYFTHPYTLHDGLIKAHLEGKKTIGILLGKAGLTKFLCFDIDAKEESRQVTFRLVECLIDYYGLSPNDIHVSLSGSKGYHVELFFDDVIPFKDLIPFYEEVLEQLGETKDRIEQRPTNQGLKLPLGINQKTGKRCYFVDTLTLKPIKDLSHILTIQPMEFQSFKELVLDEVQPKGEKQILTLSHEQGEELESLVERLNLQGRSRSDIEGEITQVISEGRLIYPNTRNRMTFLIPMFLYSQGYKQEEAEAITLEIMLNTFDNYREYIDRKTTRNKVISEVKRLTQQQYEKGYILGSGRHEIEVTKGEILQILNVKKLHLEKLLLSMLIHSKRYANKDGTFFMAYSVMTKMGNTDNRTRLLKYIYELQDLGKVEIISHGKMDSARSKAEGQILYKTNEYKVTLAEAFTEDEKTSITLKLTDSTNIIDIVPRLLSEQEAKKILPKSQFYNTGLKEAYQNII